MRLLTTLPALALFALASPALAQSHCYKGTCDGLMTDAIGSNYAQTTLGRGYTLPPLDLNGVAGGPVDASYLGRTAEGPCRGRTTALPDHVITLTEATAVLNMSVRSRGDTVLVVHGPDGWRCNDDRNGHDPGLRGAFEPGTYRVWVASYDDAYHDYRLTLRTRREATPEPMPPPPEPPRAEPDIDAQEGTYESALVSPGQLAAGITLEGRPGGSVDLEPLGRTRTGPCDGFVEEAPQHVVTLTADVAQLAWEIRADIDTTLAIHGPGGWRCNDDGDGLDPAVADRFRAGTYRVWVGTYRLEDVGSYALSVFDVRAPEPEPEPEPIELVFQGRFESQDVRFSGETVDELHGQCVSYARGASLRMVDDIVVNGQAHRNGPSYWEADALCGIAALNAAGGQGDWRASGTIEDVPFSFIGESADDLRDQCMRYAPAALGRTSIDDVVVNGQARRNGPSYWSVAEACMMVSAMATGP